MREKLRNLIILEGLDLFVISTVLLMFSAVFEVIRNKYIYPIVILFLVGFIILMYSYLFCIIHISKNKDFNSRQKVDRIFLIIFLNIFYIPIYYVYHVIKDKKWWGIINCILYILLYIISIIILVVLLIVFTIDSFDATTDYVTNDNEFTVSLDDTWTCSTQDTNDYDIYCEGIEEDKFFFMIDYVDDNSNYDYNNLFDSHVNDMKKTFEDKDYVIFEKEKSNDFFEMTVTKNESYKIVMKLNVIDDKHAYIAVYSDKFQYDYNNIFNSIKLNGNSVLTA